MNTKLIVTHIIVDIVSLISTGVALFWSAGRMDWWAAWAALAVLMLWLAALDYVLIRFNPDLLVERALPPAGAKPWDRAIVSLLRLIQLARYIIAGFDQRYGWTGGFPIAVQIVALLMFIGGYALFVWATYSNAYFSQLVRIQTERGHAVATGGPYRFVRHPGYIGALIAEVGLSTLLASWGGLFAAGACVILFVVRTALEDRTLQADLPGYKDYAQRVRYRLIPWVW